MNNKNKLKCLEHNIFGEGIQIEKGSNSEKILCSQCVDIPTSINIQQQNEQKINYYLSIQRQRYQQYKQFKIDGYIKKQKMAYYMSVEAQNFQQQEVKQQIAKKQNLEPKEKIIEYQYYQDLRMQESQLSQSESFFLINIQRFLLNPLLYDSFISYRIKWKQKQPIPQKPQYQLGQFFIIFSYQTINQNLVNDGHYIILNNVIIMDGYFVGGKLTEGMLFTDDRGKIEFNYDLKSLKFNLFQGVPFQIPFTERQLEKYLEYDQEISDKAQIQ